MINNVWIIRGRLTEIVDPDARRRNPPTTMSRIVYLVNEDFPTTDQAEAALLKGWSRNPHAAVVRAINPMLVQNDTGGSDQLVVTLLDGDA